MEITSVLVLRECAPESGDGSKALGARLGPAGRPYYNCMPPLPMLNIQFSNRLEVLRDALLARVAEFPASPLSAPQIIVPSGAMRRHLTLAMADRDGICANVDFLYLAEWLWRQIGHVVESVETDSPYATPVLTWRIFPLLHDGGWTSRFPRLARYLAQADDPVRFDLAAQLAALFEQYITYRQDWMSAWLAGTVAVLPQASKAQSDDQDWQAELFRRVSAAMGARREHPAMSFFRAMGAAAADAPNPFGLPGIVHVFCLPAIPPLYMDLLTGLARWIDVRLYVLNPCREYWFEIVNPKRLSALTVRGAAAYQETGNRLLASWGAQTKAQIELLLEGAEHAPVDDGGYREDFPDSLLGRLQRTILDLTELAPGSIRVPAADRSIEIHVCHSLTRELEVLQDQLLALLAAPAPPTAGDILVLTPDLEAAAPLIEAVFGNAPADRRLPFVVSGRGRSTVNAAARALLGLLAVLTSRFPASALIELLQQPMIGRRCGIAQDELRNIQGWMQESGIRWGIDGAHRREYGLPELERFSLEDGLHRLFLGYALPERVSTPTLGRVPAGNAEGSAALDLGRFAHFVGRLEALRSDLRQPRSADAWLASLHGVLDEFLAASGEDLDALAEVRESIRSLHAHMVGGDLAAEVPLQVLRAALAAELDDPARGAVPSGAITFAAISSLRNLPYRVICAIGLNDGAFPRAARANEFDLMAAAPRRGDRQRRAEDRGVFLDLLLAARQCLYLSYTGRSIRDNAVLPPSVLIAELIDTLRPAIAADPRDPEALAAACRKLVVEHPLQAFSTQAFAADADPRLRSFDRELFDALRHSPQHVSAPTQPPPSPDDTPADDDDEKSEGARAGAFFAKSLAAPGPESRRVSLEQFLGFFHNPCHFLLQNRLGIAFSREEETPADDEPFLPDFDARRALAERLLPQAMQGLDRQQLESLAAAGVEYPPGTLGLTLLDSEMGTLRRFADAFRQATAAACLAPVAVNLAFDIEGEDWELATVFSDLRPGGLVRHRYDDARPTDYLAGWLTHLVICAAPAVGMTLATQWISRDGSYRLAACPEARTILERLLRLYRSGLCEPLHFFPKAAWEYILTGRNLGKARAKWHPAYDAAHGEDRHAAYQLALRGKADPIDADFAHCAEVVFGPVEAYIDDVRLDLHQARASRPR